MVQTSVAAPAQTRLPPETQEDTYLEPPWLLEPLWRLAGDLRNARVLIVAEQGLDLMCGLIRRGCPAATVLRPGDKPDADDYDVVLVPRVTAFPSFEDVIRLARRSLVPNGRLIAGARDVGALARRLRLNGFSALHSSHLPGLTLLRADLRRSS